MTDPTLRLVSLADLDDAAAQRLECADALAVNVVRGREAEEAFAQHTGFDALIVDAHSDAAVPRRLAPHSADRAVLVVADDPAPDAVLEWLQLGVQDILSHDDLHAPNLPLRVRASDVVASLGEDCFAVLLASILAPADAQRVGAKLLTALQVPLRVGGQDLAVAAALGVALFPGDGKQPDALLRRALGLAASAQAQGRAGLSNFVESGAVPGAANDP